MKITEDEEKTEKKPQERQNTYDLVAYRKKRKKKSRIIKLCVLCAVGIAAVIIALNFSAIIEPLRGIASKIETKTSNEIGFPIKLPGSATYSFEEFGDNFMLLTDTYLYAFSQNGGQLYALRHGFTNPVAKSNSKRILIYDKGYSTFSLFSKTSKIYDQTVDERILYGTVSKDDMTAIVTDSARYTNVIYVYDGSGNWKYMRRFIDENVMQVTFSNDGRYIYVATIGADNGEIYTSIYKYDISSEENELWKQTITGSSIPCIADTIGGNVAVVFDDKCVCLSEETGEIAANYGFSGTMLDADISDSQIALLYTEKSTNKTVMTLISSDGTLIAEKAVRTGVDLLKLEQDKTYIIDNREIKGYNASGEEITANELSDEYSDFIVIGNNAYLLGYDTVDNISLG